MVTRFLLLTFPVAGAVFLAAFAESDFRGLTNNKKQDSNDQLVSLLKTCYNLICRNIIKMDEC